MSEVKTREYAIDLLTKFHELELAKIKHPGFNVVDIGKNTQGEVCVFIDNMIPLNEIGVESGSTFMGARWYQALEYCDDEWLDDLIRKES